MRYGSKEHEEFAKLAEEVRNHLATSFAMYCNHDPCDAWHLMESTELTHGLYDQIVEFQELCNAAAVPGVELCENEYQTKSRALAGRFQAIADKLDLNSAGRRVLQDSIVGQAPRISRREYGRQFRSRRPEHLRMWARMAISQAQGASTRQGRPFMQLRQDARKMERWMRLDGKVD